MLEGDLIAIRGELSSNQGELGAARSDFNATKVQAAPQSGDPSLAVMLGLAGIGVGAVGVGMAARAGRSKRAAAPPERPQ